MTTEHSDAYYDYKRNDPNAENPFTDPKDRARAERVVSGLVGKMNVDTEKYLEFVDGVTSDPSKDVAQLLRRISELEVEQDCNRAYHDNFSYFAEYIPSKISSQLGIWIPRATPVVNFTIS